MPDIIVFREEHWYRVSLPELPNLFVAALASHVPEAWATVIQGLEYIVEKAEKDALA